jgi:8-oxo-dGTP pyrophosphatase MutT (NUDIX family)
MSFVVLLLLHEREGYMTTRDGENPGASLAQQLALYADILRDCSANGLQYADTIYDRDNYRKVQNVALELFALAMGEPLSVLEPLRATVFTRPAPFPVADGAVIGDDGKILLIQRADNGLWALPGGGLEVGESPAQGAVREVLEETGVSCEPVALVGINDSRLCGTRSRHHLYHILFLCRPLLHIEVIKPPSHVQEVLDSGWFSEHDLPVNVDPGHRQRIPEAFRIWRGERQAYFDR